MPILFFWETMNWGKIANIRTYSLVYEYFPLVNSFKNGFVTHKKSITKYYKKKKLLCIILVFRVKVLYYVRDTIYKARRVGVSTLFRCSKSVVVSLYWHKANAIHLLRIF